MKQLVAILTAILLASCSSKIAPLTNHFNTEPVHHKWSVTEMDGVAEPLPPVYLDMRNIYVTHGSAGCDSVVFTPKYENNNRMNFSNISVPLTACKGTTLTDQRFLQNLREVHYFSVGVNQLSLFNKSRKKLFEAVYHPDDERGSLLRRWQIVAMMNANSEQLIKDSAYLDLTHAAQGSANAGCNQFNFPVTFSGKHDINFGNAATTRKFCKDAVNEEVFSKVLPLVKMYQVVGNVLKLFDKDNALLLEATAPLQ